MLAHFGIARANIIDSLIVEWPDGGTDVLVDVAPRQMLTVTEGSTNLAR